MTLLRRIRRALRLPPRQVFEVPPLPDPAPLTADELAAIQDYTTATYPAYRLIELDQLAAQTTETTETADA